MKAEEPWLGKKHQHFTAIWENIKTTDFLREKRIDHTVRHLASIDAEGSSIGSEGIP